jgi:HD superfamily phosphohydrolase
LEVIMNISTLVSEWQEQLAVKYGDRRRTEYQRESPMVSQYLTAIVNKVAETYTLEKPWAVGGTGIVFIAKHQRFPQRVVIKFNRPNLPEGELSMVENETRVLPALNHPNIIRVLDVGEIVGQHPKLTYLVEPFITGSRPLFKPLFKLDSDRVTETWLKMRLDTVREKLPAETPDTIGMDDSGATTGFVNSLLADLASVFAQWTNLLDHLHAKHLPEGRRYVYLDVKPENVLVDEHLHLTSIDYGSVEHLDDSDDSPVQVFFTERYAHKFLIDRKKDKASSNRVRGAVKRSELRVGFDYYALGTSMLEILNEVAMIRPHLVPQLPLYRSLHFLATRLLDGQNSHRPTDNHYGLASQVFPSLLEKDYSTLRYVSLADAYRDLEKEQGRWNLEAQVPELATYSKDIVRVVAGFNTVLTARLRGIIEHPVVGRLKYVTQLGLAPLVYPTADHSRYDHSLGSYTYTTNYVKSLFNDLGNPIFRNFVGTEDLNAVLLASLLHDLGQYPLAHDLEEVHDGIFKHTRIGMTLLEDPMQDRHGRTLKDIIAEPKNGWGVAPTLLGEILGAHSRTAHLEDDSSSRPLKVDVLAAIIDGPVDADKADYIIRDSARCELPYGDQLDIERLLRVLTVAIIPEEAAPVRRVTLGVYDKGIASAHAFGQARYQLLATVYWHHTMRVVKAMLQYSTALGLPRDVFGPSTIGQERKELEIREQLLDFVKSLVPPFDVRSEERGRRKVEGGSTLDLTSQPPDQVVSILSEADVRSAGRGAKDTSAVPPEWYPGISWTDWLMLRWISELPSASGRSRNLIRGIQTRILYKRIAMFARGGAYDDIIRALEELDWPDKIDLCVKLHAEIHDKLRRDWRNLDTATSMNEVEFDRLCDSNLLILIDVPRPSKKVGYDRPLGVVPELKEKSYQQDSRQAAEDKGWKKTMEAMIDAIAPVRILCHPKVRNLVSAHFAPVESKMADHIRRLIRRR